MLGQLDLPDTFHIHTPPPFLRMCGKGLGPRLHTAVKLRLDFETIDDTSPNEKH